ncbi:ABC transporter ATP-binding protein [Variovorax sp. LT2P21]|uniref:ABC transporter ATP-binding protein n=1 Tax=Variovorax sp. LT2P21 TaxID=3443731 RepID=UPI003F451EA3
MLRVSHLGVRIGQQTILHDVSIEVPQRGIVSVLGSNGVGKTTLMRALSGVYKTTSGQVSFEGRDITNRPPHEIVAGGLAQAPEGRQIFSAMTVLENLKLGAGKRPATEFAQDLDRMLTRFPRLKERLTQKAGSMSGGEQQMLCIARALMSRPRLLLMDEPSMGLAPIVVRQVFELVRDIRAEGTAVLLVEQNARAALRVADTAYVMDSGRIVLEGDAASMAKDPRVSAAYLGGHAS